MKVVACLMEVEAAVVAIKTSASPKEYDGYVVYPEVRLWRTTKDLSWDICRY